MPGLRPPLRQASARLPLVASSRRRAEASCGSGKFPRTPLSRSGAGYGAAGARRPQDSGLPRRALPPPSLQRPSASLRASPEPSRQTSFSPASRAVGQPSALHSPPVSAVSRLRAALAPRGDLGGVPPSFPGCRAGPSFAHRAFSFRRPFGLRCFARAVWRGHGLRPRRFAARGSAARSCALRSRAPSAEAWGGFPKPLAPAPGAMFTRTQSAHPRRPPRTPPANPPAIAGFHGGGSKSAYSEDGGFFWGCRCRLSPAAPFGLGCGLHGPGGAASGRRRAARAARTPALLPQPRLPRAYPVRASSVPSSPATAYTRAHARGACLRHAIPESGTGPPRGVAG